MLVGVLKAHGAMSTTVAEQGCGAMYALTASNATNVSALGVAGACEGE